ncbi:MAG: hypothetical protein ACRYFU_20420 [Janthinobacterium lividum]
MFSPRARLFEDETFAPRKTGTGFGLLIAIQAAADQPKSGEPPVIPDPLSAPTLPMPAFLHGGVPATFADPSDCAECF